jgi:hypothetical protein
VHLIEAQELFDYTIICPTPPVIGSVVVVDPFSSGVNLAALVLKMGYKLILIFSESKDKQQGHIISKSYNNHTTVLIQHDSTAANQVSICLSICLNNNNQYLSLYLFIIFNKYHH